jgi:chromosome segregation ATPase
MFGKLIVTVLLLQLVWTFGQDVEAQQTSLSGTTSTKSAEDFQKTVTEVTQMLQNSSQSREQGAAALDKMLNALRGVEASVSDQGPIWQQYANMLSNWEKNQKQMEDRAVEDPAFRGQADAWAQKVHEAADLRAHIAQERNRVQTMIADVERDRDLVLGWYSLGQADKALDGLRKMNTQLENLNNDIGSMLQQAKRVGAGA